MADKIIRLSLIIGMSALLRYTVTFHPYSGEKKPSMFGDYEAQRHWQEITYNLPVHEWYINSTYNDLQYWGLDYPPLTAYHSLIMGKIAHYINPKYVQLHASRGYESVNHKLFMRLTVFVIDLLVYIPAIWFYFYSSVKSEVKKKWLVRNDNDIFGYNRFEYYLIIALVYPGVILIDHGHFQYNCVSLGLFVISVTFFVKNRFKLGSLWFVLALNYKQMELYHALPIFFYILGICRSAINRQKSYLSAVMILLEVSLTVIITFIIIWLPFLRNYSFVDVFTRLFPISRGVFEDKVSNVWCAINIVIKLKSLFDNHQLAVICLAVTIITVTPSCLDIYYRPSKDKLLLSFVNVALGFYLFSFQVHEKSILLVAIPVVLCLHKDVLPCFWFLIVSVFSMLPLLVKDGLIIAVVGLMMFYITIVLLITDNLSSEFGIKKPTNEPIGKKSKKKKSSIPVKPKEDLNLSWINYSKMYGFIISMLGMIVLMIGILFCNPPDRYPDLFPLLISLYSCGHFLLFFVYFNVKQIFLTKWKPVRNKSFKNE
ncbi:probable dolichyl pyrophosphate Man9GlcNAc2 alpha-1,3-glucosyltransferase [Chelonus insularis]|uniref:probable dolichyl pyrophosphate Man9GlcNAc2 alpha-1,3-glucosyltransferase n=1 Tax=Chelonus insularis TaxID=460826 RepID=UPI00158A8CFC|nr:probable dolichyl pyrophosphate Man9GlcNAc2 alpha-1,3-glucosyltransferase [Chelonus insularis]